MRRVLAALGGVVGGMLLAATGLLGEHASTTTSEPRSMPLALDRYCRHLYGDAATVYTPHKPESWSCGTWRNGIWGLEPIDLHDACRWQRGEEAALGPLDLSKREVTCTI
jgi:hypothetical protein